MENKFESEEVVTPVAEEREQLGKEENEEFEATSLDEDEELDELDELDEEEEPIDEEELNDKEEEA